MSSKENKNTFTAFEFTFTYESINTKCYMNYIIITFVNCCLIESNDIKKKVGTFYKSIVLDDCFVPNIYFN